MAETRLTSRFESHRHPNAHENTGLNLLLEGDRRRRAAFKKEVHRIPLPRADHADRATTWIFTSVAPATVR